MTACACGCAGNPPIPQVIRNPPGLTALHRRVGHHPTLLRAMLDRLASQAYPGLQALSARDTADPAVALLDCWAVIGDILAFYTERIANEGYLRTATDPKSLELLGRLVGYQKRPGVSAGTYLAYQVDPGADPTKDPEVLIARGSQAQTVPEQGQDPQPFETDVDVVARASWNTLPVRTRRPVQLSPGDVTGTRPIPLAGTSTNLKPGDRLLFDFGDGPRPFCTVVAAEVDSDRAETLVTLATSPGSAGGDDNGVRGNGVRSTGGSDDEEFDPAVSRLDEILGALRKAPSRPPSSPQELRRNTEQLYGKGSDTGVRLLAAQDRRIAAQLYRAWRGMDLDATAGQAGVYAFRATATVFGATAPLRPPSTVIGAAGAASEWDLDEYVDGPQQPRVLWLDAEYPGVAPGSWVVIVRPRKPGDLGVVSKVTVARITDVMTSARQAYGIAAKVTRLELDMNWLDSVDRTSGGSTAGKGSLSTIRDTTVYLKAEELSLAGEPITDNAGTESPVGGSDIELADLYRDLEPGRWAVVTGERADIGVTGVTAAELVMISRVEQTVDPERFGDRVHSVLHLAVPLAYTYRRDSVRIYGNLVPASHGASRQDALGSGDAGQAGQRFALWQQPLTWVPSAHTPSGAASTLQVRVDAVRWYEVDSLAGRGPSERIYDTRTPSDRDGAGKTVVRFGDGVHGARLPTGVENVRARYRVGLGTGGNVLAGQITQLTTRPLGVTGVINPLPGTGGAEPDDAELARRNTPLPVTALDRLVSVPDYEAFSRNWAGIGRARATVLRVDDRDIVHVTVAGVDDILLASHSALLTALRQALTRYGDPALPVRVDVRELVPLFLKARVKVDPDWEWEQVEPALRASLLARFGTGRRDLAVPVPLSEVLSTAHTVSGVDYVDVDAFAGIPPDLAAKQLVELWKLLSRIEIVPAEQAGYREGQLRPAQLVAFSPLAVDTLILEEVRS